MSNDVIDLLAVAAGLLVMALVGGLGGLYLYWRGK